VNRARHGSSSACRAGGSAAGTQPAPPEEQRGRAVEETMMNVLSSVFRDVRYSVRTLRATPAFTAGAVLTIALTIGTTTAMFSVVYAVLLRQLPYENVERVFWIWSDQSGSDRAPFNVPDFLEYRRSTQTLSGFAGFFAYSANLSDEAAAERVQGIRATGNLFDVLGAHARIGRLLELNDEQPGAEQVVVLAAPFWVRRFGGDPAILGRRVRLNSEEYTVVGVMAAGFAMPIRDVEFVLPFAPEHDPRRGARNSLNFIIGAGRPDWHRASIAATVSGRKCEEARCSPHTGARRRRRSLPGRAHHR